MPNRNETDIDRRSVEGETDKPRRSPATRTRRKDEPVIIPLDFEQALGGILQAGPHPKDDELEPAEDREKAPPKRRRSQQRSETKET